LKGNLPQLAEEMGNSPREIIRSYKRNVTDGEANAWFNVVPPVDYWEVVYTYIQKGVGRMTVNLQKAHFGCSAVKADSQEINADLGSLQDLEARGVEPLSSQIYSHIRIFVLAARRLLTVALLSTIKLLTPRESRQSDSNRRPADYKTSCSYLNLCRG
jgi:hypothetical protein